MRWMRTSALLACLLTAGCQAVESGWAHKLPWSQRSKLQESQYETPSRMATIWTPDVLTAVGKPPVRGFGGRFYFYNATNQAVPVEGQLVVYAYDDTEGKPAQQKAPDRKFAFSPEQFTKHYSKSDLGASYSVWIPWDEVGGLQRSISLVPVFTSTSGQIVMGQQAINVLPGKNSAATRTSAPTPTVQAPASGVIPISHYATPQTGSAAGDYASASPSALRTTTITLPPSLRQRRTAVSPEGPGSLSSAGIAPIVAPAVSPVAAAAQQNPFPMQSATAGEMQAPVPAAATYPVGQPPGSPSVHFAQPRYPVPARPSEQSGRTAFGWRRFPGAPQFPHPFSQQPQRLYPTPGDGANAPQTAPTAP